jgi:hypothetical protein
MYSTSLQALAQISEIASWADYTNKTKSRDFSEMYSKFSVHIHKLFSDHLSAVLIEKIAIKG